MRPIGVTGNLVLLLVLSLGFLGCAPRRVIRSQTSPLCVAEDTFRELDLADAKPVPHEGFEGADRILLLTNGALLIRAGMAIDVDGSPNARVLDPRYGQLSTSLQYPGRTGQDRFVDAEKVPYIVLPRGFYERFGISLGDLAVVSYRGRAAFAVFADVGPADKLGEGSMRLAELLGHRPWASWRHGETFSTHGSISGRHVEYLIFPGHRVNASGPEAIEAELRQAGCRALDSTRP